MHCFMGTNITEEASELLNYGVDKVFVYDQPELKHFVIEPYANVLEDFIEKVKTIIHFSRPPPMSAARWHQE